jgi:hypothetical protein
MMFSALAGLVNRRPWRVLVLALVITAVAALVRLSDPVDTPGSLGKMADVESRLRRDPAVVAVLDARSARNPAMISRDRRSAYVIAALRPLDDKQQEEAGRRFLGVFAGDPRVTLGGGPVANFEISKTIEDDLHRAELLAIPLIVVLSFFLFRGFVASLLAPIAGVVSVLATPGIPAPVPAFDGLRRAGRRRGRDAHGPCLAPDPLAAARAPGGRAHAAALA